MRDYNSHAICPIFGFEIRFVFKTRFVADSEKTAIIFIDANSIREESM